MATSAHCYQPPSFAPSATAQYGPLPSIQGQSRIAYFITRTNGTPVPLIPADELPYTVKLQHVPRVLTPDQTYGLNYIGNSPYTGTTFKLETSTTYNTVNRFDCQPAEETLNGHGSCNMTARQFQAPDSQIRQSFIQNNTDCNRMVQPSRPVSSYETSKSWRRSDPVAPSSADSPDAAQNAINAILRSQAGAETAERIGYRSQDSTPPPSGGIPDQEKKEWCTYWILHGDCAYVQQGCRYRHEMPDKSKLAEIGIHHVPRWWLEQNSAIKLGGDRNIMGPVVKPEEWLKSRKSSDADSESSSTDSASIQSARSSSPPKIIMEPAKASTPPSSTIESRPTTPTELLLDFVPLIPTSATSASSSSTSSSTTNTSTPPSSHEKVAKHLPPVMSTPPTIKLDRAPNAPKAPSRAATDRSPTKSSAKAAKVFVPAGESSEVHIADAKKRAVARNKASRTPSPTKQSSKTGQNLEKLIGEMRKAKVGGLFSSVHAHAQQSVEPPKRRTRTGCRERRPVSSSVPAAAQSAKK